MTNQYPQNSLSISDVIIAGFRIYRDHFKQYFTMALVGCLWLIVPVYGWAKCLATLGAIARLAFFEVSERPEPPSDAKRYTNKRQWSFLGQLLLVGLIIIGIFIGFSMVLGTAIFIFMKLNIETFWLSWLIFLLAVFGFIILYMGLMWISARLYICDVILALEDQTNAKTSIKKSWEITEESEFQIMGIFIVAVLATLPFPIATRFILLLSRLLINSLVAADVAVGLNLLVLSTVLIAMGALTLPFFKSIKAVIYYDLINHQDEQDLVTDNPKILEI